MRKILLLLVVISTLIVGCSKEEPEAAIINNYAGTSWTAPDDIAQWIYGGVCTTTIEFFDDYTCQEIEIRAGMKYGAGTFTEEGTYRLSNDSVYWTVGDITIGGFAKGSAMTTTMGKMSGGYRTYIKDK